jgi:hypothetical protein
MPLPKGHPSPFKGKTSKYKGKERPERWKYKTKEQRLVNRWYLMAKAQARFRHEPWELTFWDYYSHWRGNTHLRGRSEHSKSITRINDRQPWRPDNIVLVLRRDAIARRI